MAEDITTKYRLDISDFEKNIKAANQAVRLHNAEFKAATAGMDDWSRSSEGVEAKIRQLNGVLEEQKRKLDTYNEELKEAQNAQRENAQRAEEMRRKYQQAAQQYGASSQEAKTYKNVLTEIEKEEDKSARQADRLRITILNQQAAVGRTERDLRQYSNQLEQLNEDLQETSDEARDAGNSIESMEGGFTVVKGAIAGLLKDGLEALVQGVRELAQEGEDAMDRFQAATGTTNSEMGEFSKEMNDLYKNNYGESIEDIADSMAKVKQQTKETDPSKLKEMTKNAMTLSETFDSDLNETVRGANSLMYQWGMTSEEAFDLIAKGSQEGLNYTDELGDNLAEYAGKFQQAGYSSKEYFQLLKNGTQNGAYNLDKVNDAINEVTTRLADGTIEKSLKLYSKNTQNLFKDWQKGGATQKEVIESIVKDIADCKNEQDAMNMAAQAFGTMAEDGNLKFITSLSSVGTTFANVKGTMEQVDAVRYDNAKSQLATLGRTIKTDILQPIAMEVLPGLNNFLNWFVSNIPIILSLLASLGAGFAVFKIGTTIATLTGGVSGFITVLKNLTLTVKGLGIVMATTPVGWITAIVGAVAGIAVYTATTKKATSATDKQVAAIEKEIEAHKELSKEIKEHKKNRQDNIKSTEEEGVKADYLYKRLTELLAVQKKDAGQKAQIKSVVDQLNAVMPELNLKYDEEKDKLNQSTEAIKKNIEAQKDLILAKASQENMESIASDIASKEVEQIKLIKEEEKANKELKKAEEEAAKARKKWEESGLGNNYSKEKAAYDKAAQKVTKLGEAHKKVQEAIKENKRELKELNTEYGNADKYAQKMVNSAQIEQGLAEITEKCRKKSVEIPKAVSDGIRSGQFEIPKTVSGMKNLIQFHDMAKKAKLDGVKIPKNLAQGISSGKISAKQAIKSLEKVAEFDNSDIVKKAKKNGIAIPKSLREGIASGKISVKKAASLLTKTVDNELKKTKGGEEGGKKKGKKHASGLNSTKNENKKAGENVKNASDSGMEGGEGKKTGKDQGKEHASGLNSTKKENKKAGTNIAKEGKAGAESVKTTSSGENFSHGFINGIGSLVNQAWTAAYNLAKNAWSGLKKGQKEGSPSKLTTQSGRYFGEGYVNGILSMIGNAIRTAGDMGQKTSKELDEELEIHSPSAVTYKSGVNFTKGFVNGIASMEKNAVRTAQNMVSAVVKEMLKLNNFNFPQVTQSATQVFTKQMESTISFMNEKISYQNEQKINSFDTNISKLEKQKTDAEKKLKTKSKLADKIDDLKDKKKRTKNKKKQKAIQKDIDKYQKKLDQKIKDSNKKYDQLIKNQEKYKDAYQEASSKMLEEFQSAMSEYQSAAEELVMNTMNGISDTYQAKYDALIEKQNNLITKLQSAGELFEVSSAGVMTINDIKAQTNEIKEYSNALKQIKGMVSQELFDQIASYDMEQGKAFMDQLLSMNQQDLKAYDKAYQEKMQISEELAKELYKDDIAGVQKEYENAVNQALKELPKQLEELGKQAMQGFLSGLKTSTSYMSAEIRNLANAMIDNFKKELQIHSPSVRFAKLGEFSGLGYVNGWVEEIGKLKKDMVQAIPMRQIGEAAGYVSKTSNTQNYMNQTKVVNQNFTQNNYSPKALTPLEIYRQTHNALSYAKG